MLNKGRRHEKSAAHHYEPYFRGPNHFLIPTNPIICFAENPRADQDL
jgi:hypothetical protein